MMLPCVLVRGEKACSSSVLRCMTFIPQRTWNRGGEAEDTKGVRRHVGAYGVVQGISHPLQRLIIEVLFNTRRWRLISDYLYGWMGGQGGTDGSMDGYG